MNFKHLLFSCALLASINVQAELKKNDCDIFEDKLEMNRDNYSEEKIREEKSNIDKCRADMGESPYYKDRMKNHQKDEAKEERKKEEEIKREANLEKRIFTGDELTRYGKPFFAKKITYNQYGIVKKTEVLTEGVALCKLLGYDKASEIIISAADIVPEKAYQSGYIVEVSGWSGNAKAELYDNKKIDYVVRKFITITCVRAKEKGKKGQEDLKKVVEIVMEANAPAADSDSSVKIDNSSRIEKPKKVIKNGCETTEYGYVREGCGQDSTDSASGKSR